MNKNVVFVDVREPEEYSGRHLKNAINLPLSELADEGSKPISIPKSSKVVLYCNSGRRSELATKIFKNQGYKDVINGIDQDQAADFAA
ncbi:MAG TPA: rhodanese-like domain-containing protein [Candidatus Saccharimonadales bacterium]|nr:rhodanese-like domain-containing protein [Candidatus Saccharimonadales bacterium]